MALQIGAKGQIEDSYSSLSLAYTKTGNYKEALLYQQKAIIYKDSLLNTTNSENIVRLQTLFDTEHKEAQIQLLEIEKQARETQIREQRIIQVALTVGLIFILIVFTIVYKNNQNRKEINKILACQNAAILQQKEAINLKNLELIQLNDEKTHLISVVAHDLRSPLSRIFGLTNLIKMEAGNLTTEQKEYVRLISSMAEQLNDMTSKILDMNAIESQRINLKLEKVDISKLLQETCINFELAASKKQIQIISNFPPGNYFAQLDSGYATQIFENLLSNAIKFSPAYKQIFLDLEETADKILVKIQDQGPGFSSEDLPKLFGKFQKLSARPTAGENSTGLGLSIVKKYVEAMRGEISYVNKTGQGATFIITFDKVKALSLVTEKL
jgi:signal transduction histidine kinase